MLLKGIYLYVNKFIKDSVVTRERENELEIDTVKLSKLEIHEILITVIMNT